MYAPLTGLEICLHWTPETPEPAWRALRFAATVAAGQGARVIASADSPVEDHPFYTAPQARVPCALTWAAEDPAARVVLMDGRLTPDCARAAARVALSMEPGASEATLFAASGLADLNGTPDGPPLVPDAHYAAHTIGYAVYCAMVGVHGIGSRFSITEQAQVDGLSVLKWINWKAIAAGAMGQEVTRSGAMAEWPVLACADGHVAWLFTERDWPALVKMVGDPALADPRFETFKGREDHRAEYLPILQRFCLKRSKAELRERMAAHKIPGDSVRTIGDVLDCELFDHRGSFVAKGSARHPRLPERVLATAGPAPARPMPAAAPATLPLSGLRVLDLGIITAGAGVSAVLADMGAEVLKIESATYPDPFRQWAGSDKSPLFRFSNRNKYGLDIDLKTPAGKAQFLDLVAGADVVVENFRRGVIERLGLGFEVLAHANPAILLASISGQGQTGPGTQTSTFGSTLEANAGFAALTRGADGQPYITGRALNFPDQVICLYGAGLTAAAALDCRATGQGRHLDISQRDTVLYQIGDVLDWVSQGKDETPETLRAGIGRPGLDRIVTCADGTHLAVHLPKGRDRGDMLDEGSLADWAATRSSAEAGAHLQSRGLVVVPAVGGIRLAKEDGLFSAGVLTKDPAGKVVKGFPFQFRQNPMAVNCPAPAVGQHNGRFLTQVPA